MQTGRYIHIDGQGGMFHNQHRETITAKQALDFAMPEGQQHSHSLDLKPEREIIAPNFYGSPVCSKVGLLPEAAV